MLPIRMSKHMTYQSYIGQRRYTLNNVYVDVPFVKYPNKSDSKQMSVNPKITGELNDIFSCFFLFIINLPSLFTQLAHFKNNLLFLYKHNRIRTFELYHFCLYFTSVLAKPLYK